MTDPNSISRAEARGRLDLPDRIDAARLPTPVEPLERAGARLGLDLWIKRDDTTGFALGGNKVRKLEFSFARLLADGADTALTLGGVDSNHCRATVYLARRRGLDVHLLLRTPDGGPPDELRGNTLLDVIAGAGITWVTPEEYRRGADLLAEHRARLGAEGARVFPIPEGASDPLGSLGFVAAAEELAAQEARLDRPFDAIVHAVGSGGTSAGLTAGRDALRRPWRVLGVPVCDGAAYFEEKVSAIRAGLEESYGLPREDAESAGDRFVDGHAGEGYGLTTAEELDSYAALAREEGILVDPCYTGKAWRGLEALAADGTLAPGSRVLFWHTGGAFAQFTHSAAWTARWRGR